MSDIKKKIVIALDVDDESQALDLVKLLKKDVGMFKVGKQLFTRYGPSIVSKIHEAGGSVFLDLKFHDIPNTVAKAGVEALRLGVKIFNIHLSGGSEMVNTTVEMVTEKALQWKMPKPIILGVTVLTSLNERILKEELSIAHSSLEHVVHLALLGEKNGLDGVVASPRELVKIREACGSDFIILTPGIRPSWAEKNDQKRIMTPGEAVKLGADYLVIGRPVSKAPDPLEALRKIVFEIEEVKED